MGRELKFRVWDIDSSEMVYSEQDNLRDFYFDLNGEKSLSLYMPREEDFAEKREAHVMQFTGLKDKNGKDIYEGDLIVEYDSQEPMKVFFNDATACFDMEYSSGECEQLCYKKDHTAFEVEVIGNVYENPELLTT